MRFRTSRWLATALSIGLFFISACSLVSPRRPLMPEGPQTHFTSNEQIAGEIMAYLIEVVLGRAGALKNRQAWATRGLDLPLDFDLVSRRMFGPVALRAELMVLDTNILGLSRVMYHYDRRLNLFKGTREYDSLYPCSELMAIRLLLLKKLQRNEKVSMAALSHHAELFAPGSRDAVGAELAAMQLSDSEFHFLKAIFQSEPAFLTYMRHPFIVSTLRKIGVVESDAFTVSASLAATYSELACQPNDKRASKPVTIAILPAMNPMFEAAPATGQIRPSGEYTQLQETITAAITLRFNPNQGSPPQDDRLDFYTPDRPMTITPENADRVIDQLCPRADFSVILLGKNVYRSLLIDPESDIFPYKNRIYLNVDDVRYQQIDQEIKSIVTAILPSMGLKIQPLPPS